jgi:hypothetical protein
VVHVRAVERWIPLILAVLFTTPLGCNCSKMRSTGTPDAALVSDASSDEGKAEPKAALFCAAEKDGALFVLGTDSGHNEEDDSGIDVPFGINVGQAMGYEGGFAVSAIDGRAGRSHAVLAVMGKNAQNGKKLDLGRVYGDPDPPHIAGDSRNLVLALADMDAAGRTLRLLRVEDPSGTARLTRGGEISVAENTSTTFSVAVNGDHGIVAWEDVGKKAEFGQIAFSHFLVQNLALPKKASIASSGKSDADSPQVVSREGGFWLGWVQSMPAKPADRVSKRSGSTPQSRGEAKNTGGEEPAAPAVDIGLREVYLSALDSEGRPLSRPIRVTETPVHAVAYEMATLGDSSALLAWRDDDTSPGVESQIVHLARVGLDGHVERFRVEDETIGVGEPQLLTDSSAPPEDRVWLTVGNTGERVSLVRLLGNGSPVLPIIEDADWGIANPLVRFGGVLLVARQRAGSVDLEPLRCSFGKR